MLAQLLLLLAAHAAQTATERPLAAALRNCSLVPAAEAMRFAFTAAGSKLLWVNDSSVCLTPASGGPNSTGILLRSCDHSTGWVRTSVSNGTGFKCRPYESCFDGRPCPASGVCAPERNGTDGFFLSPSNNRSLCLRAQPNFGAALLIPCHADPWNLDPWHYTPVNDSRVYCPRKSTSNPPLLVSYGSISFKLRFH